MASSIIIKVKYGESFRRFRASVDKTGKLDLDMAGLRRKIAGLFSFLPDADFSLAYTDEDGDIIALVDEDDLHDIMKQSLDPLRIVVKLNGSSNPLTSLGTLLHLFPNRNATAYEMLKSVPESVYEGFARLPPDVLSKAIIAEIAERSTKTRGWYMNPLQKVQANTELTAQKGNSELGSVNNDASVPITKNDQRTSETARKISIFCQKVDHERLDTRELFPSTLPVQDSKKVPNIKVSKSFTTSASGTGFKNTSFDKVENPCAASAIHAKESEGCGGYQCTHCGVQILSERFKISDDLVCKRCFKVEGIKTRGHAGNELAVPSMLNRIRLQNLNSSYIGDFSSVSDGTVLAPSTTFTKIWRMRNNGSDAWPQGTIFRMVEGDRFNETGIIYLQHGLPVGKEITISVKFIAPRLPGQYVSFWYVTAFGVPFGEYASVFIQVAAPLKDDKSNKSSRVDSGVSSSSSSSELGSGKNDGSTSEMSPKIYMSGPKLGTNVQWLEIKESKEGKNLKELKPVSTAASGTYFQNTSFDIGKSGQTKLIYKYGHCTSETPNVGRVVCAIPSKEPENQGGYQCSRCGIQIVTGRQFKISDDLVCKMCFNVESRKIRGPTKVPISLNQARLRNINSSLTGHFSSFSNGAVLIPLTPFTIIWRMRNIGSDSWPTGTKFVMFDGDEFSNTKIVRLQIPENGLPVGSEIDIVVDFVAPMYPGQYVSFWTVTAFGTPIGQSAVAFIQVAAPLKAGESKNSSSVDSRVSSASSSSATASKNFMPGQKLDHDRLGTSVKKSSQGVETYNRVVDRIIHRKVFPCTFPDQESGEVQDIKELELLTTGMSGARKLYHWCGHRTSNSGANSSSVSSASNTSDLGSGKNGVSTLATAPQIYMPGQKLDHERLGTSVENIDRKISPSRFPDEESKKVQDIEELKLVNTSSSGPCFGWYENPCTSKPGANETPDVGRAACVIPTKESKNRGGYQCTRCGVQIVSRRRFKISGDVVCKMCFEVESRKIRDHAYIPSRLNQVRLRKINSSLVGDFSSVSNGTILAPSTAFTKTWRMRNNGTDSWPKGTKFTMVEGDRFSNTEAVLLQIPENGLPVGCEIYISVDFVAPELPGQYVSLWHVTAFGMPIGQSAVAFIQVAAPPKDDKSEKSSGFDLNVFPESGNSSDSSDEELDLTCQPQDLKLPEVESPNHGADSQCGYFRGPAKVTATMREVETARLNSGSSDLDRIDWSMDISALPVSSNADDDESLHVTVPATKEEEVALNANHNDNDASTSSDFDDELVHETGPATKEVKLNANHNDNQERGVSDDELVHATVPTTMEEEVAVNANRNDNKEGDIAARSGSDDELVHVAVPSTKEDANSNDNEERNVSTFSDSDDELVHVTVPPTMEVTVDANRQERNIFNCGSSDDELVNATVEPKKWKYLFW